MRVVTWNVWGRYGSGHAARQAALEGVGSSIAQLVQVRVYIADVEHWASFNQIYARWAGEARPARAVVPVPHLHYGLKVEVEAKDVAVYAAVDARR